MFGTALAPSALQSPKELPYGQVQAVARNREGVCKSSLRVVAGSTEGRRDGARLHAGRREKRAQRDRRRASGCGRATAQAPGVRQEAAAREIAPAELS